jgi:hypothetical protein
VREELLWVKQQPPPQARKDTLYHRRKAALQAAWQRAGMQQQQEEDAQKPARAADHNQQQQQQQAPLQEECRAQAEQGPAGVWAKGRARQVSATWDVWFPGLVLLELDMQAVKMVASKSCLQISYM